MPTLINPSDFENFVSIRKSSPPNAGSPTKNVDSHFKIKLIGSAEKIQTHQSGDVTIYNGLLYVRMWLKT